MNKNIFHITLSLLFSAFVFSCSDPENNSYEKKNAIVNNGYAPEGYVRIPAGSFSMGCETGYGNEAPVHEVTVSKDLYMSETEITQKLYKTVMSELPAAITSESGADDYPVYGLSWYDAVKFCNALSEKENLEPCYVIDDSDESNITVSCDFSLEGYRLPTEAEWEYAARGGNASVTERVWSGTSDEGKLSDYAWYYENALRVHEVMTKTCNSWGLYDMSGNVQEFCWDYYNANQYTSDRKGVTDPSGPQSGTYRVVRGGSYANYLNVFCTAGCRWYQKPDELNPVTGFRVVRLAGNEPEAPVGSYYGIAKVCALDVSDSTVISEPAEEKIISAWEEDICIEPVYSAENVFSGFKVKSFIYDGRIAVPDFTVNGKMSGLEFILEDSPEVFTAVPVFLSAEESSNGEADEQTNVSLNFIVDRFEFETSGTDFNAGFRMNFVGQNSDAKKGRSSDYRVEVNYMAVAVEVSGSTDISSSKIASKKTYYAESPLTVSSSVAASPVLKYSIVIKDESEIIIRMNAFSYSPKMRIGDIFMTAGISEEGIINCTASKESPLYSYTANDEKIMPVKIVSLTGVFNEDEKNISFSFIPGSMPLAISVTASDFSECTE